MSPIETLVKPSILNTIVAKLDDLHLSATHSDIKGDAFEYFLRNYGGADTDFGEYFTPRHIVTALVNLLDPKFGEKVYDPFCGTGGMLITSYKHIYDNLSLRTPENIQRLKKQTVYGGEITKMYRIAKMNMILAGDGHSNIVRQNSYGTPDTIVSRLYSVMIFLRRSTYALVLLSNKMPSGTIKPNLAFSLLFNEFKQCKTPVISADLVLKPYSPACSVFILRPKGILLITTSYFIFIFSLVTKPSLITSICFIVSGVP